MRRSYIDDVSLIAAFDNVAPVITLLGDHPMYMEVNTPFTDPGATALDDYDGDLTSSIMVGGSVNTNVVGDNTLTYDVSDAHGNAAVQQVRTVHVVDTTPPVIASHGDETAEATSPSGAVVTYTDPTAMDNYDSSVTVTCNPPSGSTFSLGPTTVTCTATDSNGNPATPVTFTVTVQDTTKPGITLNGSADLATEVNVSFTDPGATALDNYDGDLTGSIVVTGSVDTSTVGSYAITYTVTDNAGNTATATRTVNVVDTHAPVITGIPTDITAEASSATGSVVVYSGPIATDTVDGIVPVTCIPASGSTFALGATTVTCSATDKSGNTASATFQVTLRDTTKPVITLSGTNPVIITQGSTYMDAGATAKDAVDGNLAVVTTGSVNNVVVGTYTITYTATDKAGNKATATRTVNVIAPASVSIGPVSIATTPPPAEPVGKVLGAQITVPAITGVTKYRGKTAIPARDGMITVRAFGQYAGALFARTVDFLDGKKITIVVSQDADAHGAVAVYDERGLLIQRIKPYGRYATVGLRADMSMINNEPYLAIGVKNGVHVLMYRITRLGLVKTDRLDMRRQGASKLYFNFLTESGQPGIAVVVKNNVATYKRFYGLSVGSKTWLREAAFPVKSLRLAGSQVTMK